MTSGLFDADCDDYPVTVAMPGADVAIWPALFSHEESVAYLHKLMDGVDWSRERITLYGKTHELPRLTAWYGDPGKKYRYSGIAAVPKPWIPVLLKIRDRIEAAVPGPRFNSVLLNLYRSGSDCMGWHSDDEPELGTDPAIGSVSFGASRVFHFRHRQLPGEKRRLTLASGDYLLMRGATQRNWRHQVPRTARNVGPRVNLTFRWISD